jgi:hypothetical protein
LNTGAPTVNVTPAAVPPDAPQKPSGTNAKLDINTGDDSRFGSSAIVKNGNIWATQPIDVNGRAAVRWYEIRPSDGAVLESGNISDPKLSLYYPSIAVNDVGTVVIGFTGSSPDTYASSYAIVGNTDTNGSLTFGSLMLLKSGLSDYQQIDGNGENRWGDYSATLVDPTDPNSFWTFQEFVAASDQWGIQITQIVTPEPSSLAMLLVSGGLLLRRRRGSGI